MMKPRPSQFNQPYQMDARKTGQYISKYWFKGLLIIVSAYIVFVKDISIQFNLSAAGSLSQEDALVIYPEGMYPAGSRASVIPAKYGNSRPDRNKNRSSGKQMSNLTPILSPGYAEKNNIDPEIVREKIDLIRQYIRKYKKVAVYEMEQFGIPASITLAQGLLESNVGESKLAMESNNHFGIKCKPQCPGCTCRNYADDSAYDMFQVFDRPAESFRAHSVLLSGSRYESLHYLSVRDYENWAKGLQKAGYATDKRYADKLIRIIEALKLYRYDVKA